MATKDLNFCWVHGLVKGMVTNITTGHFSLLHVLGPVSLTMESRLTSLPTL